MKSILMATIVVPVKAEVCELCREQYFDQSTVEYLQSLKNTFKKSKRSFHQQKFFSESLFLNVKIHGTGHGLRCGFLAEGFKQFGMLKQVVSTAVESECFNLPAFRSIGLSYER